MGAEPTTAANGRIEAALERLRRGAVILLVDGPEPKEGALCVLAERVSPEAVNFMATRGRGLVCLALTEDRMRELGIPLIAASGAPPGQLAFGASIEARRGVTTGISAADRATTIATAVAPWAGPDDVVMPGHVFPIQAARGGVLARAGLVEAATDLARLAGATPAAAICWVLGASGEIAEGEELEALAAECGLERVSVPEVVAARLRSEKLVHRVAEAQVTTGFGGTFRAIVYGNSVDHHEHLALVLGEIDPGEEVLVRVHSQCLTGDVFGSERCDCGDQLRKAVEIITGAGRGVVVYMHQEGRGIGLANKLRAYALQERGLDTVEANWELGFKEDQRDYSLAAQILRDLGAFRVRLLTNNPQKVAGLESCGIEVVARAPLEVPPHPGNIHYLRAKQQKLGHLLSGLARVT